MVQWLDAHTHLDSDELFDEKEELLNRAQQANVTRILLVNSQATALSFERTLACLDLSHPIVRYACFGIHPHEASLYDDVMEEKLAELIKKENVVALGECGLDFYYNYSPQNVQMEAFQRQLALARQQDLPLVIHCRDAYMQLAEILSGFAKQWRGMIHCFTGTMEEMKPLLDLDFHISFSGIVTFRKAMALQQCAKAVPLDRILIETDAPFLAPVPYRGTRNEPSYVVETGKFIASLRGTTEDKFAFALIENFERLFLTKSRSNA